MKHLIYLLLLSQACVWSASAQSVFLIPRAGLNLSTITQAEGDIRTGLNFGLSGEYAHTSGLAAEVGLSYSMQGAKYSGMSPEHNYLHLPFLLKYYLGQNAEGGAGGFNFFAGPQIDVKAVVNKVSYAKEYKGILLSDDMTRLFGASAVVGVGYLFDIGLTFSANLNIGLTNKAKERFMNYGVNLSSSGTYKDMVAQIKFGYRFSFR
jgi:hypothetical protein